MRPSFATVFCDCSLLSQNWQRCCRPFTLSSTIGHQLLSSRAHINNFPIQLSVISPISPLDLALESLISLQSFFPHLPENPSSSSAQHHRSEVSPADDGEDNDLELGFKVWLGERFDEFMNKLFEIAISELFDDELRAICRSLWPQSSYNAGFAEIESEMYLE
ncbi:hypothetical protein Cni_G07129 [Canna indica]|uniref:Uncharacterized protein n=1 Tax=Canna indica TaxID=4628 RepID=A0AAQ3K0J9_9LILI|nr:hypothetical protein Cni_G07129 [Canna indica]